MRVRSNGKAQSPGLFQTTHWSVVLKAGNECQDSLARLCNTYYGPLQVYLRHLGHKHEDAQDLLQGFFQHLLSRDFLEGVTPTKGRFRTFLLVTLKHFLCDQYKRQAARKRGGGVCVVSMDDTKGGQAPAMQVADAQSGPDVEYDQAWARTVLRQAWQRLERECTRQGRVGLLTAMEPVLYQEEQAPGYREIAVRLGMRADAARQVAKRLRERLRHLVQDEVSRTVDDEKEVQAELRYLKELMGRQGRYGM